MRTTAKRLAGAAALAALFAAAALLEREERPDTASPLIINEVLLRNRFAHLDAFDHTFPWVEVLNRGASPIELSGYSLTNDPRAKSKWPLPEEELEAGGRRVILLPSGGRGALEEREILVLVAPDGTSSDALVLPRQSEDRSYARDPDGSGPFRYMLTPSPGSSNDGPFSAHPIPSIPAMDPPGGFYDRPIAVRIEIALPLDEYDIRYTTDGSEPRPRSPIYAGPIRLFPEPRGASRVIRAAAFDGDERVSQVQTQSYFMERPRLRLPMLSLSLPRADFEQLHLHRTARGPSSEKKAFVEVFSPDGSRLTGIGAGMRLHGFTGREGNLAKKKSYRLHFRDRYGDGKLDFPLIPHPQPGGFQRLVLRANNDDALTDQPNATYVRDQLVRELHERMGAIVSHGAWYGLFVNAEFRGLYNVVERIDGGFLETHVREGSTEWDVVHDGVVSEGDPDAWDRLIAALRREDLREDDAYERAAAWIDLEAFTDYMVLNIWAQNHDWPHKNYFAFRPRTPEGKWTFVTWDAEMSLGLFPAGYEADTFARALNRPGGVGDLFAALFESPRYQELFVRKLEQHLEGVLEPSRVLARLRRIVALVEHDLTIELDELLGEGHVTVWRENVAEMEEFIRNRPEALRRHVYGSDRLRVPRPAATPPATGES